MEKLIDQIKVGDAMKSPTFGDGQVSAIDGSVFFVKYRKAQIMYDDYGRVFPKGKHQSVFAA